MSFLDDLTNATTASASIWHQFVVQHVPKQDALYLFVEGDLDIAFYSSATRGIAAASTRVLAFRCGNRNSVLHVRDQIHVSHPKCDRCLFFVDKDIEDHFGGRATATSGDLFCTETYSIENYFLTTEALEIVWTQLWTLPSTHPAWPVVREQFSRSHQRFQRTIRVVMAWIFLARKHSARPNLNNVRLDRIISFNRDAMTTLMPGASAAIAKACPVAYSPPVKLLVSQAHQLGSHAPASFTRGKFEIWFLSRFLEMVHLELRKQAPPHPHGSIQNAPEGLARALIGKVAPPASLTTFLRARLGSTGHDCAP